ncbi:MAG TPA: uroporphyrinogen-III synthase [Pseudomonadales bacterium]
MKRVLLTRPDGQNEALEAALAAAGYRTDSLPLLSITPFSEPQDAPQCALIRRQIANLDHYRHLIFVSTNAVAAAWPWIAAAWPVLPATLHWYAIGKATAAALASHGVAAVSGRQAMNSEELLAQPALQQVAGDRVLICRADGGRDHLRTVLQQRGATVEYCNLYRRQPVVYPPGTLAALLSPAPDFLLLNSSETIQALLDQAIIDKVRQSVEDVTIIVPGQRVARHASELGFNRVICARNAGLDAIMDALEQANN